jgi:extracellular matrix regulatory protein B
VFIHIGGDEMVRLRDIIGIFDIHIKDSTDFPKLFPGNDKKSPLMIVEAPGGEIKSVVLTDGHIYLSPISSLTLKRRADNLYRDIESQESLKPSDG